MFRSSRCLLNKQVLIIFGKNSQIELNLNVSQNIILSKKNTNVIHT